MGDDHAPLGRRALAKQHKHQRILEAAHELFAERGVSRVTTQQVADQADVAIGTLFRYASTKAELLIMVQNEKFAVAIDDGRAAAAPDGPQGAVDVVLALVGPVVACVREHVENGRTYLHELVVGDPTEPYRQAGLLLSAQLEDAVATSLARHETIPARDAATLAHVVSAILHLSMTATLSEGRSTEEVLADIRAQVRATVGPRAAEALYTR